MAIFPVICSVALAFTATGRRLPLEGAVLLVAAASFGATLCYLLSFGLLALVLLPFRRKGHWALLGLLAGLGAMALVWASTTYGAHRSHFGFWHQALLTLPSPLIGAFLARRR